jgi:hypothetical protein
MKVVKQHFARRLTQLKNGRVSQVALWDSTPDPVLAETLLRFRFYDLNGWSERKPRLA